MIFVELDVEDFPLPHTDAGVAPLVALVAIMTAQEAELAFIVDTDLVDGKKAETGTMEAG